jgi:RNA polymerase sigma factor (sigma-70 family)
VEAGVNEQYPPEYHDEIIDCYRAMSKRVRRFLRVLTQGDKALTDDLVQMTFEKAWKNWPELHALSDEEREGWLKRVASNTAVDVFRRGSTAKEKLPSVHEYYALAEADVHREALTSMAIERFIEVVDRMSPQRARVAFLYWRCGWKAHEIAKALDISASAVSQQLTAAKATLRNELSSYVPFEPTRQEGGA